METRKENGRIIQRYVDILTNGGFKALFGDAQNKDVVMSIINVLLPDHRQVVDIEYLPTEHQGQLVDFSKEYQYDFMCRDVSGAVFIVELQRYRDNHWFKRCVSYASRAYDRQNRKGEDYDVPPVYLIGLMGVEVDHPDKEYWRDKYVSEYTFREKNCHDLLGETIVIIFAEMANFCKDSEDCVTEVDKMLYVLKNIGKMLDQPHWLQHEVYTRIFNACEIAGFTEDKRIKYEKEMYDERRLNSEMKTAKRLGFEEGVKEGREEGREEGRVAGREEGREEVRAELIRTIHSKGISVMEIAQMLDMDPAKIELILAD